MNLKLNIKLSEIQWQKFFEEWYVLFFISALTVVIGFSSYVFYTARNLNGGVGAIDEKEFRGQFDASVVFRVNELLDIRAEQFNRLRKELPSVKNPF
ncbi:MAG: hypothetical protein AAB362_00295 [Patescibacteria group bacterium]